VRTGLNRDVTSLFTRLTLKHRENVFFAWGHMSQFTGQPIEDLTSKPRPNSEPALFFVCANWAPSARDEGFVALRRHEPRR
jgi:hypothetical protein